MLSLLAHQGQAQAPSWQWAAQSKGSGIGQLKGLAVDAKGNTYGVGFFTEKVQFGGATLISQGRSDLFVAKLSSEGVWEWCVSAGSAGSDHASGVVVDASGRVFVSGSFSNRVAFGALALSSQGDMDVFVAEISPKGDWLWASAAGGTGADRASALAVSSKGELVVGGQFTGTAAFGPLQVVSNGGGDAFVVRLTRAGTWQWAVGAGSPDNDETSALAINAAGDIYATGYFSNSAHFGASVLTGQGTDDAFVAKLSPGGQWQWASAATSTNTAYGKGLTVDPAGGVYVTGAFWGNAQFGAIRLNSPSSDDGFVARVSDTGQWVWVTVLSSDYLESIVGIALDKGGKLCVAGTFSRTIRGGDFQLTSHGQRDVFVGYLNRQGAWLGLMAGGGAETDQMQAMALAPGGDVVVGGDFRLAAAFGATRLQSGTAEAQVCVGRASVPR